MKLYEKFKIQFHCSAEHLIPGTRPTKDNPSWWIKQFISNPIDLGCGVIHDLSEAGIWSQASKSELCG